MCGSLRLEGVSKLLNKDIKVISRSGIITTTWLGHARSESVGEKWSKYNPERVDVAATAYTEKGCWFQVPQSMVIKAIIADDPKGERPRGLYLLTRAALPIELDKAKRLGFPEHPRHPVVGSREYEAL